MSPRGSSVCRKSPPWLAPPIPAIAPESAITARILRRVRMPAYAAARCESPITCTSKPKRVRPYSSQTNVAMTTPSRRPNGTTREPTCATGHDAASGSGLPCGKTFAVGLEVSRQYDSESKIRYVITSAAT